MFFWQAFFAPIPIHSVGRWEFYSKTYLLPSAFSHKPSCVAVTLSSALAPRARYYPFAKTSASRTKRAAACSCGGGFCLFVVRYRSIVLFAGDARLLMSTNAPITFCELYEMFANEHDAALAGLLGKTCPGRVWHPYNLVNTTWTKFNSDRARGRKSWPLLKKILSADVCEHAFAHFSPLVA